MRVYNSMIEAQQDARKDALTIGTRARIGEIDYVLDSLINDEALWRPVTRQPAALVPPEPPEPPDAAPAERARTLPDDSDARKEIPLAEGCLFYFPAALVAVAKVSKAGNDKHNPGQPMHHARGKSTDHADCQLRHMVDARESTGAERTGHLASKAWRALAELQEHCESLGAPRAPNARE